MTKLTVKLTPNAKHNRICGWERDVNGEPFLKIQITTAPEKGKANKALIALLADALHIPKGAITLVRGDTNRVKQLEIEGDMDWGTLGNPDQ